MDAWMKNAEESVRKLYMAVEHSPESIVITDVDGRIEFVNPKFTEVTGYTFAEAKGQNPSILQSGKTPLHVYQDLWDTILSGQEWRGELLNKKKNGEFYWEMASISAVRDDSGKITHFVAVKSDITERKRIEHLLKVQYDLSMALSDTDSLSGALEHIVDTAVQIDGVDCGGIYLVDQRDGTIRLAIHRNLSPEFTASVASYAPDSPQANILRAGEIIHTSYSSVMLNEFSQGPDRLRAIVIVPVIHEGKLIAAFNLASHTSDDIPAATVQTIESMAAYLGSVLLRIGSDTALQESQENLQTLFDTIDDFLFITDHKGMIVEVNQTVIKRLGYPREEAKRMHVVEMHPADQAREAAEILNDMIAGKRAYCPIPLRKKDGTLIPVETKVSLGIWGGKPAVFGISRDITERKTVEEALRASEERFRMTFDQSPVGAVVVSLDYRFLKANGEFCHITGYAERELTALSFPEITYPDDVEKNVDLARKLAAGEITVYELDKRYVRKDGSPVWVRVTSRLMRDAAGSPVSYLAIVVDITRRKQAEEELMQSNEALQREISEREMIEDELRKNNDELTLREQELKDSEERWRRLVENIPAGIAVHSEGKVAYTNKECIRLMGAARAEDLIGTPVISFVHPDYRGAVAARISSMLETDIPAAPMEEKFLRIDGRAFDVEVTTMPITYLGKKAIMTMLWDITERKRAEQEIQRLMELRSRLAAIVDSSEDAIIGKTLEGTITSWNHGAELLYGYGAAEMIGKHITVIAPEGRKGEMPSILARILAGEHIRHYETIRVTKDGRNLHISLSVSPIIDEAGKIVGASSIARDITAQIEATHALHEKNRELEIINTITSTLNSALEINDKLGAVLRDTLELVGADTGGIYLRNDDRNGELFLSTVLARSEEGRRVTYRQILQHVVSGDKAREPEFGKLVAAEIFGRDGFGAIVPMFMGDTVIGLLALYRVAEYPNTKTVQRQLMTICSQTGIAVDNHLLLRKIRASSRYLEGIVTESPDPIVTTNARGVIVSFNKSASRLLKYPADEVIGKSLFSLLPPGQQIDLNDPQSHVREFSCRDGTLVTLSISTSRLPGEGDLPGYVITLKDLSSIAGFKVVPITEKASDTAQLYHLEKGFIYLFNRAKDTHYFEVFADQVKHSIQGLCVTRQNPKRIRQLYGLEKTPIVWLTGNDQATDEQCIKPENMTALNATINKFLAEAKDGVVLLDGTEYLVARNSFESFLKLVHILHDHVMVSNSLLLICVDPDAMDLQDYHMLTTEMMQCSDRACKGMEE